MHATATSKEPKFTLAPLALEPVQNNQRMTFRYPESFVLPLENALSPPSLCNPRAARTAVEFGDKLAFVPRKSLTTNHRTRPRSIKIKTPPWSTQINMRAVGTSTAIMPGDKIRLPAKFPQQHQHQTPRLQGTDANLSPPVPEAVNYPGYFYICLFTLSKSMPNSAVHALPGG